MKKDKTETRMLTRVATAASATLCTTLMVLGPLILLIPPKQPPSQGE